MNIETLTIVGLVILWLLLATQMNATFQRIEARANDRAEAIYLQLEGLREYLYEIDPQFADERSFEFDWHQGDEWAGKHLHDLQKEKADSDQRTLDTRFSK